MVDELALRRQCLADFRALAAHDSHLCTREAQARFNDHICQHTSTEGNDMPAKAYRTLGEDLINVAVRLPQSIIDQVDAHIETLRAAAPWAKVGRSDALRDLVQRGLDSYARAAARAPRETPLEQPVLPLQPRDDSKSADVKDGMPTMKREDAAAPPPPPLRQLNVERQRIVTYILSQGNRPVTDTQVHNALGLTERPRLRDMAKAGILEKVAKGEYIIAPAYTVG
jgi:hypothetical protein